MILKIRGLRNKLLTKFARKAMLFYGEQLIPTKHYLKLNVEVFASDMEYDGQCTNHSRHDYEIDVKYGMSFERTLITLAHETVHIKQYVANELKSYYRNEDSIDIWKGVKYKNLEYEYQPWEKEATDMEQDLYQQFLLDCYSKNTLKFEDIQHFV